MPQKSIFSQFTNLYSLTKTLRFELEPTETTDFQLDFDRDKQRADYYKKIKLLFDQLHRDFINKSLVYYSQQNIDYQEIWNVYNAFIKAKKLKKKNDTKTQNNFKIAKENLDKTKQLYRTNLVAYFKQYAENWKLEINQELAEKYPEKYNKIDKRTGQIKGCLTAKGIEVLTEAGVLEVLKLYLEEDKFLNEQRQLFSEEEKQKMLEGLNFFDKFFTYFGPFNETRKNFYKADGTATAAATRIIDENLIRFCDNILLAKNQMKVGDNNFIPFKAEIDFNKEIFELNSFNKFVNQAGINLYNGGEKGDINLGQFNTAISKYIQDRFKVSKSKPLPFKNLYKIMLSEKTTLFEEETAESCIAILNEVYEKNQNWLSKIEANFQYIFENKDKDWILEKIYLKKDSLKDLSAQFFGGNNWFILEETIKDLGYGKTDKGQIKLDDFIPILSLKQGLGSLQSGNYQSLKLTKKAKSKSKQLDTLFKNENTKGYKPEEIFKPELLTEKTKKSTDLWLILIDLWQKDFESTITTNQDLTKICEKELFNLEKYEPLKETNYKHTFEVKSEITSKLQTQANLAKLFLDSCMSIWQNAKMFELIKTVNRKPILFYDELKAEQNEEFYETIKSYFEDFALFKQYDKIRNFSSKKPFSTNKFKINFENSTLLAGWDLNKEPDNTSVILKSPVGYELIVMNAKHNKVFDKNKNPELYNADSIDYRKMEYKLLPGPNKMLPKVAFADGNRILFKDVFSKYPNIEEIRENETFKKEKLVQNDLITWIAFYKDILETYPDWKKFDWKLKKPEEYEDVSKFYRDVQIQGYKLNFISISNQALEKLEKEGKIYRFQIKNKDWNKFSKKEQKSKNLQTIYWEQLFSAENLAQSILKLNGEAEIFQRPKTESLKHKQKIDNSGRLIFKGKTDQKVLEKERYINKKMFFHIPITINFSAQGITKYNDFVEKSLSREEEENVNYLGIDRGENHLLYYSLINSKGEILKQGSLNELGAIDPQTGRPKNYEKLLHARQEAKKDAQDKWSAIGNIKELKSGYLSLAIHEICKLAFENNALIILENLNYGFKKSRTVKFEKSVYQKFEVALATKLQHLVLKNKKPNEFGGVLKALQLAPKLEKVTDLDKSSEWGIIRYVGASYTSKICPLTGWHKTIYLKDSIVEIKKAFNPEEENYIKIDWDYKLKCYTFNYDSKIEKVGYCTLYLLPEIIRTTYKDRFLSATKESELYEEMKKLFSKFENPDTERLNELLTDFEDKDWKKLKNIFDQLCNIRVKVNNENEGVDVIQSPAAYNFKGEKVFFDSRLAEKIGNKIGKILPVDGDANGAYHIAKSRLQNFS